MSLTEHFFDSLLYQKSILDTSPFLDANSQRGLESSYCLLHNIIKLSVSRQSQNRHDKARQHLKNIYSIAKPLFVLVTVTISITDLASLDHREIFPRLANWWQDNAPSQKFESRTIELIHELDHERERGLVHVQQRTKSRTFRKSRGVKQKRVEYAVSPAEPTPQRSLVDQSTEFQNALSEFDNEKTESGLSAQLPISGGSGSFIYDHDFIKMLIWQRFHRNFCSKYDRRRANIFPLFTAHGLHPCIPRRFPSSTSCQ
ncbi:unnamed protein product [Penicillium nalgiovense]|uniref:Uncharacterized protein n=1 Tax=Penicillium nalgiovense TaxID=60175 RepID=A0A9W4HHD9_PENNA|nr:unnamed protein product [Penicillium nalgiovense]CAG7992164.1 unnamed protein product [Penicillium nalgiovense]CAG7992668.1 unnamed protein product [Penicillium nalgiovense]CAG7997789.1 unnamed protein product [Penicillium nalgiovense]CAG8006699.1 unnamed protein product [Penicillium nalgiovense]